MPTAPFRRPVRSWPPTLADLPTARPLFGLGRCRVTPAAAALLAEHSVDPNTLLTAHICGAWQPSADSVGTTCDTVASFAPW